MSDKQTVTLIGPSSRFLSGISYYTTDLANALSEEILSEGSTFSEDASKKIVSGSCTSR